MAPFHTLSALTAARDRLVYLYEVSLRVYVFAVIVCRSLAELENRFPATTNRTSQADEPKRAQKRRLTFIVGYSKIKLFQCFP